MRSVSWLFFADAEHTFAAVHVSHALAPRSVRASGLTWLSVWLVIFRVSAGRIAPVVSCHLIRVDPAKNHPIDCAQRFVIIPPPNAGFTESYCTQPDLIATMVLVSIFDPNGFPVWYVQT